LTAKWAERDPIDFLTAVLDRRGVLDVDRRTAMVAAVKADIDERVMRALEAPLPSSTAAIELGDVYSPPNADVEATETDVVPGATSDMRYLDAITDAMRRAM